jgi:Restriction alleviation protein Lar
MNDILNCPICGSPAEVFATGTSECYGYAWQTYGVRCTSKYDQYCDMEVSVSADFGFIDMHDDTAIELWNKVACLKQ